MGLLLGGSVITLCELMDLFLFNIARKFYARKQKIGQLERETKPIDDLTGVSSWINALMFTLEF